MSAVNYSVFILLIALTTFSVCNINAIICYSVLYIFSLFALFISIFKMFYKSSKNIDKYIENIRELSGYAKTDITGATLFAIYVFCLAGMPPFCVFLGKVLFYNAITTIFGIDPQVYI